MSKRQDPVTKVDSVTPSDSASLNNPGRGIYVGVSGDVRVLTVNGSIVTLTGLTNGVWHPVEVLQVFATGTTATGILVGW